MSPYCTNEWAVIQSQYASCVTSSSGSNALCTCITTARLALEEQEPPCAFGAQDKTLYDVCVALHCPNLCESASSASQIFGLETWLFVIVASLVVAFLCFVASCCAVAVSKRRQTTLSQRFVPANVADDVAVQPDGVPAPFSQQSYPPAAPIINN